MSVKASEIAEFLGAKLYGTDVVVKGVSSVDSPRPYSLLFGRHDTFTLIPAEYSNCLILANSSPWRIADPSKLNVGLICISIPRLAWARVVNNFFGESNSHFYHRAPGPKLGEWQTEIRFNAEIAEHVIIGNNCLIKSGACIGQEGFGFEIDEDGHPLRIPHLGRVVIGNHVEIGCNTVIARGTIGDTVIHDYVKIDDSVFVAHNVEIGENTLVIAKAEISGSVKIARNCWIGASACIREHITVGDGALVGMGAVVVKDVEPGSVVVGNPARKIRMRRVGE